MATLPLRQIEGKYEILEKIKEGGMGAIYKVRHRLLDEIRVVKVMRPQIADSEELQQRFAREARAAIRLKHPNIAQLYDFAVEPDGVAYMVMEFIDGVTLQEMLARNGPAPLDLTLEMARQGLEALRYLHAHGYVHRDVAPDNLMLTKDFAGLPQVKLIDLGIVKHLAGGGEGLTATGTFLGKVRYSSPEQFSGEKGGLDQRSDLYSFGVMLYELLTGKCPIVGENLSQLVAAHLFQPPLSFEQTDPEGRVPEEIRTAVMRSLVKAPAERIGSAKELQDCLVRQQRTQNLSQDLEATLSTTIQLRVDAQRTQPGTTQDRLDGQFGLVKTPGPGAGLRAADSVSAGTGAEPLEKLFTTAQQLAQERRWEEARLALYQALALDPDHAEIRELLTSVETSYRQAIEEEKRRQAIAQAVERVEACLGEERPDDAERELERARVELGDPTELSGLESRIAELRAALAERARQAEIGEAAARITALLDAEQTAPAATALAAAEKRFGGEESFRALRLRLADVTARLEERRREQAAAARREQARALLGEAAELAGRAAFAEAIVRAEKAVALAPGDAEAERALQGYRADEARRLEQIRRQHALDQAATSIEQLLQREQADAAGHELEAAVAAYGADERLDRLGSTLEALRRELEERERERARQQAIAAAVSAVESHLANESADEAQSALEEAAGRLGEDARFPVLEQRIARLRTDLLERQRQRELEERRRQEQERRRQEEARRKQEKARLKQEEAQRKQEEERLRLEAEARRQDEERRLRREEEARRKLEEERRKQEEERLRLEAEARRRQEEEHRLRQEEALRKEAEERRKQEEERLRLEAEARRQEEERRARQEEARRKEEERRRREEAEARRRQAAALLRTAAELAGGGDLARAHETARAALELDPEAARGATEQYKRALDAEARAKRLDQLLAAARRDIAARRFEPALKRLKAERAEHGADGAWQALVARTEAGIAQREADRKRQQAVEDESAAIGRLIDLGRHGRAEKRLSKARAALGEAEPWIELKHRLEASLQEQQQQQRAPPAVAAQEREAVSAPTRVTRPVYWAAAAGLALVVALGAWSVSRWRSSPPADPTPAQELVAGDAGVPDSSLELQPPGRVPEPPSSASGAETRLAAPQSGDDSQQQDQNDLAERPEPGRGVTDRDLPAAVAQERPPERTPERRSEPEEPGAQERAVALPSSRVDAVQRESAKPDLPAAPPPETRSDRAAQSAPASAVERSAEAAAAAELPVEELPVTRSQPTAAAVRPPPPRPAQRVEAPPVAPRATPPRASDQREEVLATLGRYRAAYESLDAEAVVQVFTGADVRELRRAFRQSKSMSVQIDLAGCQTSVDGERATAACTVTRVIDPKAGERVSRRQRETFQLRKVRQAWVVEAVR